MRGAARRAAREERKDDLRLAASGESGNRHYVGAVKSLK
jgi:hypothetical protein